MITMIINKITEILQYVNYHCNQYFIAVIKNVVFRPHFYNGINPIAEYAPNGSVLARYIYAGGRHIAKVAGADTHWYHCDALGSPRKMTNERGSTVWSATYYPFGEMTAGSNNTHGFTGKEFDSEMGLNYFCQRYYDPEIGRFMTLDPFGGYIELPQSQNRYAYCIGNPLKYIDPLGLDNFPIEYPYGFLKKSRFTHPGGLYLGLTGYAVKGLPAGGLEIGKGMVETTKYIDDQTTCPGTAGLWVGAGAAINMIPGLQGAGTPLILFGVWKYSKAGYGIGEWFMDKFDWLKFEFDEAPTSPNRKDWKQKQRKKTSYNRPRRPRNKFPVVEPLPEEGSGGEGGFSDWYWGERLIGTYKVPVFGPPYIPPSDVFAGPGGW